MSLTFDEYQKQAISTLVTGHDYGDVDPRLMSQVLGLVGESGEFAEKFKKILRDKEGKLDSETNAELLKELGDVLWYVAQIAAELGLSLDDIAEHNIKKLYDRMDRGVLQGSGDNR